MEIRDLYYILAMIGIAISGIIWVRDQNGQRKTENELVKQDLNNHKSNHEKLEQRVSEHESKIDEKLDKISQTLSDIKQDLARIK